MLNSPKTLERGEKRSRKTWVDKPLLAIFTIYFLFISTTFLCLIEGEEGSNKSGTRVEHTIVTELNLYICTLLIDNAYVCTHTHTHIYIYIYTYTYIHIYIYIYIYIYIDPSIHPSIHLSIYLSIYLSICLFIFFLNPLPLLIFFDNIASMRYRINRKINSTTLHAFLADIAG